MLSLNLIIDIKGQLSKINNFGSIRNEVNGKKKIMHDAYFQKKKKKCQGTFGIPFELPLFTIDLKRTELCIPS